jgi:hypothetical protein
MSSELVSKTNVYAVLAPGNLELVSKANVYAVVALLPPAEQVSKANIYAVLSPVTGPGPGNFVQVCS